MNPQARCELSMDILALAHQQDRSGVVEFVFKKNRGTRTGNAKAQPDMDALYDKLNEYVEQGLHDAAKDVVKSTCGTSLKIATFVAGYAKICAKLRVHGK